MKLREAWAKVLAWIDSREGATDKALRDAADADLTARWIYGGIAIIIAVAAILLAMRSCSPPAL